MLDYTLPLTAEESAFAEENHDMIRAYLRRHRLPFDDFYDIAVFGYLRAVRKYLARPELRQYKFRTIAYRAMSCDVHHSREYWSRARRRGEVCSLNEDQDSSDLRDTAAETLDNVVSFEELASRITPMQRRIAVLRSDGYSDKEIAAICGIKRQDVPVELENAKCRILNLHTDNTAMAA